MTTTRPAPARSSPTRRARGLRVSVVAVGLAAVLMAGCGSSSDTASTADGGASGTTGDGYDGTTTSTSTTTAAAPASGASVSLATVGTLGQVLVGPNGRTLYLFEKDTGTTTACTAGCVAIWPALKVDGTPSGGAGVTPGMLSVAGGQVVYNGHLLYYYAGDAAPGDAKGVGIPAWFPVNAAGNKVGGS